MGIAVSGGIGGMPAGYSAKVSGAASVASQLERMRAGNKRKQRPKKKLKYNSREIAGQLQRASKSRNAAVVLTRAKSRVAALQSAKASGQYQDSEVRVAIAHARRMVQCSRLKVNNLKEEEMLKSRNNRDHMAEERKKKGEVKRRVHQKEQDLKLKMEIERNQRILKEKMRKQELSQKQRMHRSRERGKILEADMKYLQKLGEGDQPVQSVDLGSVALELSIAAEQMAQLQQAEQQIEQQVEAQVEMEMAGMEAGAIGEAALPSSQAASGMPSGEAGSATGAAVDISL